MPGWMVQRYANLPLLLNLTENEPLDCVFECVDRKVTLWTARPPHFQVTVPPLPTVALLGEKKLSLTETVVALFAGATSSTTSAPTARGTASSLRIRLLPVGDSGSEGLLR